MPLYARAAFILLAGALLIPAAPLPGEGAKSVTNSIGMKLVKIPSGEFLMGSPASEEGRDAGEEQHRVRITREFYLGVHEVTQSQFKKVLGYHPSFFSNDGKKRNPGDWYERQPPAAGRARVADVNTLELPVENVSWEEAKEFCELLSSLPEEKKHRRAYRLPTEAEWEYSCRGPVVAHRMFHMGDRLTIKLANYHDSALNRTTLVGSYPANGWGLFDLHGNVTEWCSDRAGPRYYSESERDDPKGPAEGLQRVVRGGCWESNATGCRLARRSWYQPSYRCSSLGFRVAFTVPMRR